MEQSTPLSELPLIALGDLGENEPTKLSPLQEFMSLHLDLIHTFWWVVFTLTFATLVYRFIWPEIFKKFKRR